MGSTANEGRQKQERVRESATSAAFRAKARSGLMARTLPPEVCPLGP